MYSKLTRASRCFSRTAYAVFLLIVAAAVAIGFAQSVTLLDDWQSILLCSAAGLAVGIPLLHGAGRLAERLGTRRSLLLLLGICLIVKLLWVLKNPIEPDSDYATFYRVAKELREGIPLSDPLYVALFPHILGYSTFLSLFMRIFGTGLLVPVLLNVALSLVSAGAIFYLGDRLGGLRMAAGATLLWSLCPSQTIYNMFVLSEPLYTTLILLFLCLVTWLFYAEVLPGTRAAGLGILGGLLLTGINAVRPIAVILMIALVLWLGLLHMESWREKTFRRTWLIFLAVLIAAWMLFGSLWNSYLTQRVGQEPSSLPGFNICVGLNSDSYGTWNIEDSTQLQEYRDTPGATAVEIQGKFMEEARQRLLFGEIDLLHLLGQKLRGFLWKDSVCVHYARNVLTNTTALNALCNGFYHMTMLLAFAGAVLLLKQGDRSPLFLPMVFVIGLTLAQLLVEVAGRYHYSIVPMFCLLSAWFISRLTPRRQNKNDSGQGEHAPGL